MLVMLEEFPLKDYYWSCDYNFHLRFDETHIPMWNCLRISFTDLDQNVFPEEKKQLASKENFIETITFWQGFFCC